MNLMFSPKDPDEVVTLAIDFSQVFNAGETVDSCVFSVIDQANGTAVDGMLEGDADRAKDPIMMQRVKGGTAKHNYLVKAKVVTSESRTLVGSGGLQVRVGA